jgi:hypothetical protein
MKTAPAAAENICAERGDFKLHGAPTVKNDDKRTKGEHEDGLIIHTFYPFGNFEKTIRRKGKRFDPTLRSSRRGEKLLSYLGRILYKLKIQACRDVPDAIATFPEKIRRARDGSHVISVGCIL